MALPIDQLIQVNVSKQQAIKSLEDFGLLCVFTENTDIAVDAILEYNSAADFDNVHPTPSSLKSYVDTFFQQSPVPTKILIARVNTAGSETYPEAIERVKAVQGFYAVGLDNAELSSAVLQTIVATVNTLKLLLIVERDASDVLSVASTLTALNSTRCALIAVDDATVTTNRPDAAWYGVGLTRQAGAINWANKNLTGVLPTALSNTVINNWLNANVNAYVSIATTELTLAGTTLGLQQTYIDQIQAMDWIEINLQTDILNLLISVDKIPYTDPGVKTVEAIVEQRLRIGQQLGILDPTTRIVVSAPSITTLTPEQRSTRVAPTITASARLSGAINKIIIDVNVEI